MINLQIAYRKVADLVPYARNPRKNDHAVDQVAAVIREFGFRVPIIAKSDGTIVDGHLRYKAAQKLGLAEVPTVSADDLTETQIRALRISVNRMADLAEWDAQLLELEVAELEEVAFPTELVGFDLDAVAVLAEEQAKTPEVQVLPPGPMPGEDDVPEVKPEAVTRLGDVWLLGKHRVMCGDSTSIDAVEKLMVGAAPDMVFADPPYGIQHSGKGITANGVEGNDFGEIMGDGDVSVAVDSYTLSAGTYPQARLIFWGANYYCNALPNGCGWLVWDKQREGAVFSGAELAFVNRGVRLDVFRHQWHGMVKASEHGQARVHPTQKPIALAEWCFANYGNPSLVLDPFGGSGSTLLACERTSRTCRSMELDPNYCDVIVRRWQKATGQAATLEGDGRTFDAVAEAGR